MDLEQLIKACKKRNINAQSQLYQKYKDDLYVLCLKYCKNREEAQDNLQDAFITVFDKIKSYKGNGSFEGWIKRITINKAIDRYKNDIIVPTEINDNLLIDSDLNLNVVYKTPLLDILKFIQELPTKYRLVFNLYELDNYSHNEISKLLNISIGTSKSNLHRAKKILQNKIKNSVQVTEKPLTSNEF